MTLPYTAVSMLPSFIGKSDKGRSALNLGVHMKILAINGSHRAGKDIAGLLNIALEEAAKLGAETELVELSQLDIKYCVGCNKCLFNTECSIQDDDMPALCEKMLEADGIIFGSPNYFSNVSGRMKTFIDRTRPMHMMYNQLKGKVGGYLSMSGLDNTGGEVTNSILDRFCATHEMTIVHPRPEGAVLASGCSGSLLAGMADGKPQWRRGYKEDEIAIRIAEQLGKDVYAMCEQLAK